MRREAHHKDDAEFEGNPSPKCTTLEHPRSDSGASLGEAT